MEEGGIKAGAMDAVAGGLAAGAKVGTATDSVTILPN